MKQFIITMNDLRTIRSEIDRRKGQRDHIAAELTAAGIRVNTLTSRVDAADKARVIIQEVAKITQQELEFHISELVSLALSAVFDDPYKFKVDFVIKRERTEAELYFERDGERVHPMTASGGGAVDVAANALRFALWSLKSPRTRNTIILDEPYRFLSKDAQPRAAAMLKEISRKLGIQVIMVSHNPDLIEAADKAFEVTMRNGVSSVKEVGGEGGKTYRSFRYSPGTVKFFKTPRQGADEDRPADGAGVDSGTPAAGRLRRRGRDRDDNKQGGQANTGTVPPARVARPLRKRG